MRPRTGAAYEPPAPVPPPVYDERTVGCYYFEDGQYARISIGGNVDTPVALVMCETLIALERDELAARKGAP